MFFKIAIVEDEAKAMNEMKEMIAQYAKESKHAFDVSGFHDAFDFLTAFHSDYDAIFLDIQMPGMNGMEVAEKIRKIDTSVLLVFVTNLAQYAIDGYNVQAYDFILKPVNYQRLSMKLDRLCNKLEHVLNDAYINLSNRSEARRVQIMDISYVEVINHDLIFHLSNGTFQMRGTLKDIEKKLSEHHFVKCNSCYLVNLKFVTKLTGDYIEIAGQSLKVSRSRRQAFLGELAKYIGGSV